MRPIAVLIALGACAAVSMVGAIAELASEPPFALGLPRHAPIGISAVGVRMARPSIAGRIDLRAARASPGHAQAAFFRVGPSTFLALDRPVVSLRPERGEGWGVRADEGRLTLETLTLEGGVVLQRGDVPGETPRRVRIDLARGTLEVER